MTQETSPNNHVGESTGAKVVKQALTIGGVGLTVSMALYPLDVILHGIHTNTGTSGFRPNLPNIKNFISGVTWSSARMFLRGYPPTLKAAMTKNVCISQRGNVKESIDGMKSDSHEKDSTAEKSHLTHSLLTAGLLGMLDATATNYHSGLKTLETHKLTKPDFSAPKPNKLKEHFSIFKNGLSTRTTKSIFTIGGYITTPFVADYVNGMLNKENSLSAKIASLVVTGATTGILTNMMDIIYKRQIIQMNESFKVPSMLEVAKTILKNNGPKEFLKGYKTQVIYSITAFSAVNGAEKLLSELISDGELYLTKKGFFAPATEEVTATQDNDLKKKKDDPEDRSGPTPGHPFS